MAEQEATAVREAQALRVLGGLCACLWQRGLGADGEGARKLRGWNARCLVVLTGREIRDETVDPSFDIVARLRSRRLRWAGHILRQEETSLVRQVLVALVEEHLAGGLGLGGGLLMDAPAFGSLEQLLELAGDRDGWRAVVRALLPLTDKGRKKKKKKEQ